MTGTDTAVKDLCVRSMQIMVDGSPADFAAVVHPDAHNRDGPDGRPERVMPPSPLHLARTLPATVRARREAGR